MGEEMEFCLEKIIKKTNPEEYIKILEQDREDFAEEINRLNNIIDELEKWLKEDLKQQYRDCGHRNNIIREVYIKLNELKGDNK